MGHKLIKDTYGKTELCAAVGSNLDVFVCIVLSIMRYTGQ